MLKKIFTSPNTEEFERMSKVSKEVTQQNLAVHKEFQDTVKTVIGVQNASTAQKDFRKHPV